MNKEFIVKNRLKVAEIIQNKRIQKNLTQEQLAEMVGFSRNTIIRIEKGAFSPNADQLYIILKQLDINLNIGGEDIL